MVRKSRRSVYDPSIMDRVNDPDSSGSAAFAEDPLSPDSTAALTSADALDRRNGSYRDNGGGGDDDANGHDGPVIVSAGTDASIYNTNSNKSNGSNGHADRDYDSNDGVDDVDYGNTNAMVDIEDNNEILDPRLHKIRTDKRTQTCRRRCLMMILIGGLIALIVTVSVIVSNNNKKKKAASSSASTAAGNGTTIVATGPPPKVPVLPRPVLQPPSDALKAACERASGDVNDPNHANAMLQCEEGCEQADCCDLPGNFDLSCLVDNQELCMQYHKICHVLDFDQGQVQTVDPNKYQVPAAPTNIGEMCSLNSLLTNKGVKQCSQVCVPNHCCYESDSKSCLDQANCAGYHPCLNLDASDNIHNAITDEIDAKCDYNLIATSKRNRKHCRNSCKLGKCCFEKGTGILNPVKCKFKPDGFCTQYRGCKILHDGSLPDIDSIVTPAPVSEMESGSGSENIDDALSLSYGEPQSESQSSDIQSVSGASDFEIDEEPETSASGGDNDNEPQPEDQSSATGGGGGDGELDAQVGADTNDGNDDQQQQQQNPVLAPLPDTIETICNPDAEAGDPTLKEDCDNICAKSECCNYPENLPNSCLANNHLVCLQYHKFCAILSNGGLEDSNNAVALETAPPEIMDVCSTNSISTAEGLQECVDMCEPGKCCYELDQGMTTNCREHANCATYAVCMNIRANGFRGSEVSSTVDAVCTSELIRTVEGRAKCNAVCLHQRCCLHGADTCSHQSQEICDQYASCALLFEDGDETKPVNTGHADLPPIPSNLIDVCTMAAATPDSPVEGDTTGRSSLEICSQTCSQFDCCKIPENFEASCLLGNTDECLQAHQACAPLVMGLDHVDVESTTIADAPVQLWEYCSFNSLATPDGRDKCQEACEPVKCCYSTELSDGSVSCRNVPQCPGYAPCLNLEASDTVNVAIENEIDQKCTIETATGDMGHEVCRSVCAQHECCWTQDEDKRLDCYDDLACQQYDGCILLLDELQDTSEKCTREMATYYEGKNTCIDVCSRHECCWKEIVDPATNAVIECYNDEACLQFEGCLLVSLGDTPPADDTGTGEGGDMNGDMNNGGGGRVRRN